MAGMEMASMENKKVTWSAPEHEYYEKNVSWYWISIIIAVLLLGVATWQGNFLFAVFIVIAEILIISLGYARPRTVGFGITPDEFTIGGVHRYSWSAFDSYSVNSDDAQNNEWVDVYFRFKNNFKPLLKVKVGSGDLGRVCVALNKYLVETEWDPSFIDALWRWTKF